MMDHATWEAHDRSEVPPEAKMITNTWGMKKKASGTSRARLNAQGFEQIDGKRYNKMQTLSPVVNKITL